MKLKAGKTSFLFIHSFTFFLLLATFFKKHTDKFFILPKPLTIREEDR